MTQTRIVVIGAGVSGLTTAVELKRHNPKYDITIISKHLPGDLNPEFTSPYAGANWSPFGGDNKQLDDYEKTSYFRLMDLAHNEPRAGIWPSVCYEYNSTGPKVTPETLPWFKLFVDMEILPEHELLEGSTHGFRYNGMIITVPIYLNYLLQTAISLGIDIRRISAVKTVQQARHLHSSGQKAHFVINCSGFLCKDLGGFKDDKKLYGVLGQVVHVRNSTSKQMLIEVTDGTGDLLYIFPRKEGGCIIGGCFRQNYTSVAEDPELTKRIVERAAKKVPELIDPNYKNNPKFMDIVAVNVGQRPYREGGVRVGVDLEHPWLIHNYGAGGGGYQGSYGFSAEVIKCVEQANMNASL